MDKYSESVDIWGLGCILFRLLSGKDAFHSEYQQELFNQITTKELTFIDPVWLKLSKFSQDLLKQLLLKDQYRRPSIIEVAKHFWFNGEDLLPDLLSPTESTLEREAMPLKVGNEIKRFTFEEDETPKTVEKRLEQEMQMFYTPQKSADSKRKWSLGLSDTATTFLTEKRARKLSYFGQICSNHN